MSKAIQSVRSASDMHRLVRRFRNPVSFSRHSSISLMALMGFSLLGFAGISGALLGSSAAYADESVRYDVNVNSSLTLGFSADTVSLNLNPGSKTFASQDITTTVSTNNQYGYDLYVTSDGTDLINQTDNTKTIPTLPAKEDGYDAETFLADKWGVMKNNTSYQPFVSGATVSQSSTVTNADNTVLTFGAKTSYNTAPGNYKLSLTFQLIPRVATNDLTINFGGSGVAEVKVCKVAGDCTGDDLVGRVTAGGSSVPGLKDGSTYYLYPIFSSGYEFVSWVKNSSDASVISDTTILNPTFTMSDEPASVTVTGKSSGPTVIIKNVSNMTKVSLNGTECTSTSGCTISGLKSGTAYELKAYYTTTSSRFTGWTVSNSSGGTITNTANAETTFTPGSGTVTITPSITTSCTAISSSSYIQSFSFTSSHCDSGSLTDRRDNQIYTVARLNDGWWMTRNLAIGCNGSGSSYGSSVSSKSLTSTYSNVNTTWSTPVANSSSTSGYTTAVMQCSSTYGAWYNYAAASAGTITGDSNSTVDTYNICPKGWTLPTETQFSGITSYSSAFSPVTGGLHRGGGTLDGTGHGWWWSATTSSTTTYRRNLSWNSSSLYTSASDRDLGHYVRCVRSS